MNITSLKAVLIIISLLIAGNVHAEKEETNKQKELRIENDLTTLFQRGMNAAAVKLGKTNEVKPFAIIKRTDGTFGVFEIDKADGSTSQSVMDQALSVRKLLIELALAKQIEASVLVMYALVGADGKETHQGLTFEIEHKEGVSLMRVLPVRKDLNEANKDKTILSI